jgi:hypothetical protein
MGSRENLMLWMGTSPNQPEVAAMLDRHEIGLMCQPLSNAPRAGWLWAADNGCFAASFNEDRWRRWLEKPHPKAGCLLATVPDVVGDHSSTMIRWRKLHSYVQSLRYPVAFVAQDGATVNNVPWSDMDVLFIGGTTSFKQGFGSGLLAKEARNRGKWVHVGRVNSFKRLSYWSELADSADGTFLAFGPQTNSRRVKEWVESLRMGTQMALTGQNE